MHDDEFVAAHARDSVGIADQLAQAGGHYLQQPVAGVMSERVVHRLEPVEVEMVHGYHAAVGVDQGLLEALVQAERLASSVSAS